MKHTKPFNRKAKAMAEKNDPEVLGLACGVCCREHAQGSWSARFELKLVERVRMV